VDVGQTTDAQRFCRCDLRLLQPCTIEAFRAQITRQIPDVKPFFLLDYACCLAGRKIRICTNADMNSFLQSQLYQQTERMRLYKTQILLSYPKQHERANAAETLAYIS
jgi:hypothetical protein